MTAQEARAQQWKSLKDKPLSAKLKYIFTYYWPAIVGGVLVIIFLTSWIGGALLQKEKALSGYLLNGVTRQNYSEDFAQNFMQYQGIDSNEYTFDLLANYHYSANEMTDTGIHALEAIIAQIAAGELDFLITDMETYPTLSAYYADLRAVFTAEQLEKYKPYTVYIEKAEWELLTSGELDTAVKFPEYYTDDTGLQDPIPFGICLPKTSRLFEAYVFSGDTVVFGITRSAPNVSNAIAFLEYITN